MALIDSRWKTVRVCGFAVLILASILAAVSAQSDDVTTGNGFTPDQEVRLGRESATVVRRLLPLLVVRPVNSVVRDIDRSLVDQLQAWLRQSRFRYSFGVLNVTDLLSYALPGGPIFVSRGMIEAAPAEAALAGLLAHQVSHVALRHGSIQRTRGEIFEPADLSEQVLGGITLRTDDEPPFLGSNFSITGYFLNDRRCARARGPAIHQSVGLGLKRLETRGDEACAAGTRARPRSTRRSRRTREVELDRRIDGTSSGAAASACARSGSQQRPKSSRTVPTFMTRVPEGECIVRRPPQCSLRGGPR